MTGAMPGVRQPFSPQSCRFRANGGKKIYPGYLITTGVRKVVNKLFPGVTFDIGSHRDESDEYDEFDAYLFKPSPASQSRQSTQETSPAGAGSCDPSSSSGSVQKDQSEKSFQTAQSESSLQTSSSEKSFRTALSESLSSSEQSYHTAPSENVSLSLSTEQTFPAGKVCSTSELTEVQTQEKASPSLPKETSAPVLRKRPDPLTLTPELKRRDREKELYKARSGTCKEEQPKRRTRNFCCSLF